MFRECSKRIGFKKKKEELASTEKIAMVSGDKILVRKLKADITILLDREARM